MNLAERLKKSRNEEKLDFRKIPSMESAEELVAVKSRKRLKVEPIWVNPIDDLEGPLYKEYIKKHPDYKDVYLRKSVSDKLLEASKKLPKHWKLILRAGHRPLAVQRQLLHDLIDEFKKDNLNVTDAQALDFARTYVSDPEIKSPPHCCGAAVDIDALDVNTGKLIDFGCPMNTDAKISFLHSSKITKKQRDHRLTLLKAMLSVGFASMYSEWWHFSYGDQNWAWFYEKPASLYGLIEPKL